MTKTELNEKTAELRRKIELAASTMSDKDASTAPELFPTLHYTGNSVSAGTRIRWGNVIKVAAVTLWDREDNDPDHAPTLWEELDYIDGVRKIPEVITVAKAFSLNERGWWKGEVYVSLIDTNVYNPEQYAAGWRKEV